MNNEDVVNYVTRNSGRPNADIVAGHLLTGRDIEFLDTDGKWKSIQTFVCAPETIYRLKPQRPAYRVYRHHGSQRVQVQNRTENGDYTTVWDATQVVFLTDWIEYDKVEEEIPLERPAWPSHYVECIAAIDPDAAEWIVANLDTDTPTTYGRPAVFDTPLPEMFSWKDTSQGYEYWADINHKLNNY